ncbi:TPA: CPBP family intramembrane metalloprotease [Streptococcus suis]|nr:CPBP family intramembrane metalloprotease [Streptococcus suis]HEL2217152.1 CPBP family intramembrane metalloprotease [Streptococcus suis]HEL2217477.1 CPBP family intramembrane metalloprotease [Streptococcus suis]HEM4990960.1 CPBP family intramembrane metalloprotease [Streptococcus suis]HEM5205327.1 CPBP family intramembrane metalloprotease [Streptococcus suis]
MVKWIKSILQVLGLNFVIQAPVIAEMSWGKMDDTVVGYLIHVLCWFVLTALIFWLLGTLRKKYRDDSLQVREYSYVKLFGLVLLGIVAQLVVSNIFLRLSGSTIDNSSMLDLFQSKYGWMALLSVNILGPIREEYLYRGVFQERIRNKAYPKISVFVTTVIFTFVHTYDISVSFWMLFFPGLVFSWVYYKTNHLKYPILAHIASNIIVTFFNFIS